jgi:NAD(P)-dependent dehydrogenase (short-subunit alcohol dehydrogenase family)
VSRLAGKAAIVTGAGSGIGRAIALRFAAEGARVLAFDVSGNEKQTAEDAWATGEGEVRPYNGDVTIERDVISAVDYAVATFGPVTVLCNAAGINHFGELTEQTAEDFRNVLEVNLIAPFQFMKHVIPHMLAAGTGSIINISSVGSMNIRPRLSLYAASKAGLNMLTKGTAVDYADRFIRVNAICPGVVETGMTVGDEATKAIASRGTPIPRMGRPEEIAAMAALLASDEMTYATGATFNIDGGRTAT